VKKPTPETIQARIWNQPNFALSIYIRFRKFMINKESMWVPNDIINQSGKKTGGLIVVVNEWGFSPRPKQLYV
jgi:hypothetical protein